MKQAVLEVESQLGHEATQERERSAYERRRVHVSAEPDGMAGLWALLPAVGARSFALGLDELARRQRVQDLAAGVDRTADQRRADLLVMLPALALHALDGTRPSFGPYADLVTVAGGAPGTAALQACCTGHPSVVLNVHVPVATLLGVSNAPGDLDGHGPISADQVRLLLPEASLRRVLVDVTTGEPVHADARASRPRHDAAAARARVLHMLPDEIIELAETAEPQYRPSSGLARFVRLREPLCTAPGCSTSSVRSDLDHEAPWPAGPTATWNLTPRSRRCHRAKTLSWRVHRRADGGHVWRSPTGRSYAVPPPWLPPPRPFVGLCGSSSSQRPADPAPRQRLADEGLAALLDGPAFAQATASGPEPDRWSAADVDLEPTW